MQPVPILAALAAFAVISAAGYGTTNHCCKTNDNPIESRLVNEVRTKVEQYLQTETISSIKDYRPCRPGETPLVTLPATWPSAPPTPRTTRKSLLDLSRFTIKGGGGGIIATRQPILDWGKMLSSAKPEDHLSCPDYEIITRQVPAYRTVTFSVPVYKMDECAEVDIVCCKGYTMIHKTCQSDATLDESKKALDFLTQLGIVG